KESESLIFTGLEIPRDYDKLKEDFTYIMESFKEQAVYIPLTVSSTLAVYDSSLKGLDLTDGKDVMPVGSVVRE
ncbi:hypothetical protein LI015_26255, partial [Enterocloster sp. 210928-DFI.2.20]|nr:hypothetical protein [Enterocloster sp. 210928-DFI.2.20]MCB7357769.1 hypothetical protein [Enterocloster bolteae]